MHRFLNPSTPRRNTRSVFMEVGWWRSFLSVIVVAGPVHKSLLRRREAEAEASELKGQGEVVMMLMMMGCRRPLQQ